MPDLIKPFRLSCMQNMQTIGDKTFLFPTVFFGFSLLDPDAVLTEASYLETATGSLPSGGFLDMGYPKRVPEVLIAGEARAPAGTMVRAREVSVTVGKVTKRALVFGDRYWVKEKNAIRLAEPQPFESMPLTAELAFGNDRHPTNPAGRGCEPEFIIDQLGYALLPNIEDPGYLIAHPKDRPEPVLFGPLSHEHPLRKSKLGTPTQEWIQTSFPDPPPGFDRSYFNVAPADQRLKEALTGDERVLVAGMSADNPSIATRLPGLRIRLFAVHDRQARQMTEITVALETVWIFGSAGIGGLYYRGAIAVADKQASDIVALVLGAERLSEEPRPGEYYAGIYRLRTDPREGAMHTLNDTQLMPPMSEADAQAMQARSEAYSEEVARKFEKQFAWEAEQMIKESGMPDMLLPDMKLPPVPRLPFAAPEDIVAGRVDLAGLMRGVNAAADAHEAQADVARAAFFTEQAAGGMPIPPDMGPALKQAIQTKDPNTRALFEHAAKGGGLADNFSAKGREMVDAAVAKAVSSAPSMEEVAPGSTDDVFAQVDAILAKLPGGPDAGDEEELFLIARARALALPEADPFYAMQMRLQDAAKDNASAMNTPTKGERVTPDKALADAASGTGKPTDFKAVDAELKTLPPPVQAGFARIDALLAELLPKTGGQDLPPALALAKAQESAPKPASDITSVDDILAQVQAAASATEESFFAGLDEDERAFLSSSDHERSQLPDAVYPLENYTPTVCRRLGDLVIGYIDRGESFAGRDIAGADLSGADLSHLDLSGTLMERADLTESVLRHSVFVGGALTGANLTDADASSSDFSRANISRIAAARARFDEARFSDRVTLSPNFTGASFRSARFEKMMFQGGMFKSADFSGAEFVSCAFFNCDLTDASFRDARFEKCFFLECGGAGSDWSQARFDRLLMSKLKAPDSRWTGASFSRSTFVGNSELPRSYFDRIKGHMSSFLEANLDESCFLRAEIPEFLFLKCAMSGVDFRAARARRAVFNESALTDTDFFASDLMEAQLGFCDARRVNFRGANLFSANLTDMKVAGADLSHANLGQTVLELPT